MLSRFSTDMPSKRAMAARLSSETQPRWRWTIIMASMAADWRSGRWAHSSSISRTSSSESTWINAGSAIGLALSPYLSTSAITKSMLAMMAMRSATMKPRLMRGICCKAGKEGVRTRVR